MVTLDDLVGKNHPYRKLISLVNFEHLCLPLRKKLEAKGTLHGYGINTLFRCLLLQFYQDLSDRQLQDYLQENMAARLFCGFSLNHKTPTYSLFSKVRDRIGTQMLAKLFNKLNRSLKRKGYLPQPYTIKLLFVNLLLINFFVFQILKKYN